MKRPEPEVGDLVECLPVPERRPYGAWQYDGPKVQYGRKGKIVNITIWNSRTKDGKIEDKVPVAHFGNMSHVWPLDCLKIIKPLKPPVEQDEIDLIWEKKL